MILDFKMSINHFGLRGIHLLTRNCVRVGLFYVEMKPVSGEMPGTIKNR